MVAAIAVITVILWLRTSSPSFLVAAGAMYYWSLHGAWGIIIDHTGSDSGLHYQYLEQELFPIRLDSDYFLALSLYGFFIITTLLSALFLSRRDVKGRRPNIEPVRVSPGVLLAISVVFAIFALVVTAGSLADAVATDSSLYSVARPELETGGTFVLYQISMEMALIGVFLGLVSQIGGNEGWLIVANRNRGVFAGNVALLAALFVYAVVAGSKGVMFSTTIFAFILHMANTPRPRYLATGIAAITGIYIIISIDVLRYYSPTQLLGLTSIPPQLDELTDSLTKSNEAFGAHFSMYGVLSYNVPPTYGLGVESLLRSLLPKFAQLVDRGSDLYQYYIDKVGGATAQGFSIHYATGWYLDFGVPGIAVGSVLLGGALALFYNIRHPRVRPRALLTRSMIVSAPAAFIANFPYMLRAPGIESVKGMLIDSVALPAILLFVAASFGEARASARRNVSPLFRRDAA